MNGKTFKIRHKEWAIECGKLALKTTPWLILMLLPFCGMIGLFTAFAPSVPSGTSTQGSIPYLIMPMVLFLFITAVILFGVLPHASYILLHRIDQGMKNDPITAAWYVFHDRAMWTDHFKSCKNVVLMGVAALAIILGSSIVIALISPDQPLNTDHAKDAAAIASKVFFDAHPFINMISDALGTFFVFNFTHILYREFNPGVNFTSFLQANSYKDFKQTMLDATSAKNDLFFLKAMYVQGPILAVLLFNAILPMEWPIIRIFCNALSALVILYVIHMHYIIGRDYYIGPPAKKAKETKTNTVFTPA